MVQHINIVELLTVHLDVNPVFNWATFIPVMACLGIVAVIFLSCVVMKKIFDRHDQNVPADPEAMVESTSTESDYCSPISIMTIPRVVSPVTSSTQNYSENSFQTAYETQSLSVSFNSSAGDRSMPILSPITTLNNSNSETRSMFALSPIKIHSPTCPISSPSSKNVGSASLSSSETQTFPTTIKSKTNSQATRHLSHLASSKVIQYARISRGSVSSSIAFHDQSYDDDSVFESDDKLSFQPIDRIPSKRVIPFQEIVEVDATKFKTDRCASWPQARNVYNTYSFQELDVSHLSETGFEQYCWGNTTLGGMPALAPYSSSTPSLSTFSSAQDSCESIADQNILLSGGISDYLKKSAFTGLQHVIGNPL